MRTATIVDVAHWGWRRLGRRGRAAALGVLAAVAISAVGTLPEPSAQDKKATSPATGTSKAAPDARKAAPEAPKANETKAASETKAAAETTKTATETTSTEKPAAAPRPWWLDGFVELLKAVSWALVVLVLLIVFRRPVAGLLEGLKTALADRAVTFDVASVKIQVSARDPWDEQSPGFSRSLLEIEETPVRERSVVLSEIAPQLFVPPSGYMARRWAAGAGATVAEAMRVAREALRTACEAGHSFTRLRSVLLTFVEGFVDSRFFEADEFGRLLTRYSTLATGVGGLHPGDLIQDADDFRILHSAGVGYAQEEDWKTATAILDIVVWKDDQPLYLWAADIWLDCAYHQLLEKTRKEKAELDIESPEFFAAVDALLRRAQQMLEAMQLVADSGYYQRELLKVMGSVASILGEAARTPEKKAIYFDVALQTLRECTWPIAGDPPSPLDYNNLADLYRQMGDHQRELGDRVRSEELYAEAHRAQDVAAPPTDPPDPAFVNTRALIFVAQRQFLKGLLALERYGEAEAATADRPDLVQYVENQILAARLAAAVEAEAPVPGLALTTAKLEAARVFVERNRTQLGRVNAIGLAAQIEELLGYTYLQLPGQEGRAVEAYDRLAVLADDVVSAEVRWRRRLGRAKAASRLGGVERRAASIAAARQHWKRAYAELANSVAQVKAFGVDPAAASVPRRIRNVRLRLDTAIALQAVAEEGVREGERLDAKALLEQENELLVSLQAALADDGLRQGLGRTLVEVESQARECAARRCYALARILIRDDPGFSDVGLVAKVEANFAAARGAGEDLDCRIDLELGEFMLAAAQAGKGDVRARYERAVASLERAAQRNVPALRGETVRVLAEAYARQPAFLKKAKESKPAT